MTNSDISSTGTLILTYSADGDSGLHPLLNRNDEDPHESVDCTSANASQQQQQQQQQRSPTTRIDSTVIDDNPRISPAPRLQDQPPGSDKRSQVTADQMPSTFVDSKLEIPPTPSLQDPAPARSVAVNQVSIASAGAAGILQPGSIPGSSLKAKRVEVMSTVTATHTTSAGFVRASDSEVAELHRRRYEQTQLAQDNGTRATRPRESPEDPPTITTLFPSWVELLNFFENRIQTSNDPNFARQFLNCETLRLQDPDAYDGDVRYLNEREIKAYFCQYYLDIKLHDDSARPTKTPSRGHLIQMWKRFCSKFEEIARHIGSIAYWWYDGPIRRVRPRLDDN